MVSVSISLVREHTEKIKPPRALFVPFPFGMPLGLPNDPEQQHRVLEAAFSTLKEIEGPILHDFPDEDVGGEPESPLQASAVEASEPIVDVAMEVTMMRRYYEQWVERKGKTTVGLSGIVPRRFRGVVRFIEAFVAGKDADMHERPADVPVATFLRWCIDDLKAMYGEARMVTNPDETADETNRWLWGQTALGDLLRKVRDRLESSGDPQLKRIAYGIIR